MRIKETERQIRRENLEEMEREEDIIQYYIIEIINLLSTKQPNPRN